MFWSYRPQNAMWERRLSAAAPMKSPHPGLSPSPQVKLGSEAQCGPFAQKVECGPAGCLAFTFCHQTDTQEKPP